tara:strand:- start:384 stop:2570 length:2187 start_codon:yes stop_codon:yes gene_type:complete
MAVKFLDGITVDGTSIFDDQVLINEPTAAGGTLRVERKSGNANITPAPSEAFMIIDSNTNFAAINYYVSQNVILANGGGNVGIGTNSPDYKLDVEGDISLVSGGENYAIMSPIGSGMQIAVGDPADASDPLVTFLGEPGKVGIGTTNPGAKLDVLQETRVSYAAGSQYRVRITDTDGNGRILVDGQESALIFGTSAATANATATEKMRISSAGNVGIGTTSPDSKLEVIGNYKQKAADGNSQGFTLSINSSTDAVSLNNYYNASMTFSTNNSAKMTILGSGNVGIGTTSPAGNLQVVGGNPDIYFTSANTGQSDLYFGGVTAPTKGNIKYSDNADAFMFNVNTNTEAMRIISSGNVGIGTTSPVGKLEVAGNFRLRGNGTNNDSYPIHFSNTSVAMARDDNNLELHAYNDIVFGASNTQYPTSTERMRIANSGNVGIGNTAPTTKLEVNGRTQTKGINSIYIGTLTLPVALGWYRAMEWTGASRGGSVLILSLTGGNFGPVTYVIKAYKTYGEPASANTLKLEQFGDAVYINKARIAYDSELGKSFVEVYRSYGGSNTMPLSVHQDRLIGYDATSTALLGTAAAGGGQVMEELSFVANGTTMETLLVSDSIRSTSYKSSDGSAGITTTVGVRNAAQSQNVTLTIKNGIITGASSDRRLKTNITLIGTSDSGINIYTFEYKYKFSIEGVGLFQGVMSDEVPDHAVSVDVHGFDVVDYSVLDVEFKRVSI